MPDCTEVNGGMLNGETKSVCQRQGRCGGGVRGVHGSVRLAGLACCGVGLVSGSAAAASRGAWSSAAARAGIWHKAGMVVVVLVCALTDAVLAVAVANLPGLGFEVNGVVLPVVLVWYIFTELGSIAENAAAMGAPVPGWLVRILAQGKEGAKK